MHLYGDEDFDFGSQLFGGQLSHASPARSFSTASSRVASFTPQSGRSTPQQQIAAMDLDLDSTSLRYLATPPDSSLDGYFPGDIKIEPSFCDDSPETPDQRPMPLQISDLDFDHSHMLHSSIQSHGAPMEFTDPQALEHYSLSNTVASSPFSAPPPPYSLTDPICDVSGVWSFSGDTPLYLVGEVEYPAIPRNIQQQQQQQEFFSPNQPHNYLDNTVEGRARLHDVHERSSALHRVQNNRQVGKQRKNRKDDALGPPINRETASQHPCPAPGCGKRYGRLEHMTRHAKSHQKRSLKCACCDVTYDPDRLDNYASHLERHETHIGRTPFHPLAAAIRKALPRTQRKGVKRSDDDKIEDV